MKFLSVPDDRRHHADSMQLTAAHRVATPASWVQGDKVIIAASVTNDEAKSIYPDGWDESKPHLRIVPRPKAVG